GHTVGVPFFPLFHLVAEVRLEVRTADGALFGEGCHGRAASRSSYRSAHRNGTLAPPRANFPRCLGASDRWLKILGPGGRERSRALARVRELGALALPASGARRRGGPDCSGSPRWQTDRCSRATSGLRSKPFFAENETI